MVEYEAQISRKRKEIFRNFCISLLYVINIRKTFNITNHKFRSFKLLAKRRASPGYARNRGFGSSGFIDFSFDKFVLSKLRQHFFMVTIVFSMSSIVFCKLSNL